MIGGIVAYTTEQNNHARKVLHSRVKNHKHGCTVAVMNGHYLRAQLEGNELRIPPYTRLPFKYCPYCGKEL